ncbi:MAG: ATP-dependent helicase [Prevotella sp.]
MTTDIDFLNQLNDSQRKAVEYCDGPSLVIAGAGSGKTRVLTYKIAYLVANGMKAWNILALTFTNKAADEMKQRIAQLIGEDTARYLNMGTFHSIFSRILRVEAEHIGYNPNFTIYDESDSRSLLKTIIKERQLDDKKYRPSSIHARISMAKNNMILPEDYARTNAFIKSDVEQNIPDFANLYAAYCNRCRMANAMDFDDLLTNTYMLFKEREDIRQKYEQRFKYILVDEYQDTNSVQQSIVSLLAKDTKRVCAVGDDAQSIYAFRGAKIDNILDFQKDFEGTKLFKLERNYRSTQRIVQAANSLIKHNQRQIPKDVYSKNDEGNRLMVKPSYSDREEALIVCNEIKRQKREDNCNYNAFAVLYRTNAQSRSFEEAMRKLGIPYRIYGGLSFYQRKEIKDVLAYLRLVVNPDDEEALKRIINYPRRGIGDTTVNKIAGVASLNGVSLWAVICSPENYGLMISGATMAKIDAFRQLITKFIDRYTTEDAYTIGVDIVKESGISADIYIDKQPENIARQENLQELLGSMKEFVDSRREEGQGDEVGLTDFLQEVSLQTDLDSDNGDDDNKVSLMTVHSAKGLEFPSVFIVGLEENLFPSSMAMGSPRELEEERRLLYVAITRAEKHCVLTYTSSRYRYGRMEMQSPSRFLKDIDPKLLDIEEADDVFGTTRSDTPFGNAIYSRYQNSRPVASQFRADNKPREVLHREDRPVSDTFSQRFIRSYESSRGSSSRPAKVSPTTVGAKPLQQRPPSGFVSASTTPRTGGGDNGCENISEGCIIKHERFGIGTVIRLEGRGENMKATVKFKNVGIKQLLLKFARFKVIG